MPRCRYGDMVIWDVYTICIVPGAVSICLSVCLSCSPLPVYPSSVAVVAVDVDG